MPSHLQRRNFLEQRHGLLLFPLLLFIGLLMPLLPVAPVQAAHSTPSLSSPTGLSDPQELETFMDGVVKKQLQQNHIPGATVSVVKDGRLFFAKGYGFANLQAQKPASAEATLFRVGSISKLFTATAVLQLVEQGKLNLHADVNTYLKTFHIPATYPEPITLANILTHTTGFEARETGLQAVHTTNDLKPLGLLLAQNIPARVRPPGELTAYSNYSYMLAGYIVEQVSGMPFAQYVEQRIFQPLGMHSSSFRQPLEAHLLENLSQAYAFNNGAYHTDPLLAIPAAPAGAMSSTATDIAKFMIAQLQHGGSGSQRILQEATAREMQTRQFTNDPRIPDGMAYGFEVYNRNNQHILMHPGGISDFYALLALLPEHNTGIYISYNSIGGEEDFLSYPFLQAFLDHYFPAPKASTPPLPAGSAERIRQISGTYWGTDRSHTTWEKLIDSFLWALHVSDKGNGRVEISWLFGSLAPGSAAGPPKTYVEVAPWVFHQVNGQETVVFRPDPSGMVMVRSSYAVMAFTGVPWYAEPLFVLVLIVACLLIFLLTVLRWPLDFIRKALKRGSSGSATPDTLEKTSHWRWGVLPRLASWFAGTLCVINVLLIIGVLFFLFQQLSARVPDYYFGVPALLTALFILALVSVILTAVVAVLTIPVWWGRFWSVGRRIRYSLIVLAALALTWQLVYWNLLGFRA